MNLKEALKRIEELERKVRELEARAPVQQHFHYHNQPAVYQPIWQPQPPRLPYEVWCSGGAHGFPATDLS